MNSEIINETIVLSLLFAVVIIIFVFGFQVHIFNRLLNRLATIGVQKAGHKRAENRKKTSNNSKPWAWYKAWGITLPFPRTSDGETLLTEGSITLKRAFVWLIFASGIYELLTTSPPLIKNPASISSRNVLILLGNSLLIGLLSPIGFILITGAIHGISKLFRRRGTWRNFLVVYITFNAPVIILEGISVFIYQVFSLNFALLFGVLLSFYWLFVIDPVAIKVNYKFRWPSAFLVNFFVTTVFFFLTVGVYVANILQR